MLLRLMLVLALMLPAAARADRNVFVFGNSLIHHLTDSDTTAMPYWLARLARAGGHRLALDGRWGFPGDFARELPPPAQWGFDGVTRLWNGESPAFRMAGFDSVILNPPNFVQSEPPDRDAGLGNTTELTARVFDWAAQQGVRRFYLYEGWADMGGYGGFPPDGRNWGRWLDWNAGGYHDWARRWQQQVAAQIGREVALIPTAAALAALLRDGPLADLGPADLFSDNSPHGTATTYFLAALVTYAVLWNEPPPTIDLPATIHPAVRERQGAVAAAVWQAVTGAIVPQGATLRPPETGLADPSLGWGLAGLADWSSFPPFLDQFRLARPWIAHRDGQWGAWDFAALQAGGHLDAEGWPVSLPEGATAIETFVLTDLPEAATALAGTYVLRYRGRGEIDLGGRARDLRRGPGEIRFSFSPGEGPVAISIRATDREDPIRDISVIREDRLALAEAGALFEPDWIALVRDARLLRFMDWMATNGSTQRTWEDRPRMGDFSWAWRGAPVEVMVRLANEVGADPWFTLPHMADDAYVAAFAAYVRDNLDPRLRVHAEWSNEVWNFIFPQAGWARDQAIARWGAAAGEGDGWMQFAGLRAAEVADIWAATFGAEAEARLVRVVSVHTGWPGLEAGLLDAPLAVAEGRAPPAASFDAYAMTGYFGYEVAEEAVAERIRGWLADGTATERTAELIRQGSLADLTGRLWPWHIAVARDRGLVPVVYEGGTHVVGVGALTEDAALTDFFTTFNYSREMAALQAEMLTAWRRLGGADFALFVEAGRASRWGSWGAWRHPGDINPRAATAAAFMSLPDGRPREPGTFLHGVIRQGPSARETIEGTPQADILLGSPGHDILRTGGGADLVHGGDGFDVALLPGGPADWSLVEDGSAWIAEGPFGPVRLVSIDEVLFEADRTAGHPLPPSGTQ